MLRAESEEGSLEGSLKRLSPSLSRSHAPPPASRPARHAHVLLPPPPPRPSLPAQGLVPCPSSRAQGLASTSLPFSVRSRPPPPPPLPACVHWKEPSREPSRGRRKERRAVRYLLRAWISLCNEPPLSQLQFLPCELVRCICTPGSLRRHPILFLSLFFLPHSLPCVHVLYPLSRPFAHPRFPCVHVPRPSPLPLRFDAFPCVHGRSVARLPVG